MKYDKLMDSDFDPSDQAENDDEVESDPAYRPLDFDAADYREYLDNDSDLTIDQQNELLHCLWEIMRGFVDMGFGEAAINNILPSLFEDAWDKAELDLVSKDQLQLDLGDTADLPPEVAAEIESVLAKMDEDAKAEEQTKSEVETCT